MKDSHVTLRIPAELARALARWADERGASRSHIVREAVARYLDAPPVSGPSELTAAALAAHWLVVPRLTPVEAARLAEDLAAARAALPAPAAWE